MNGQLHAVTVTRHLDATAHKIRERNYPDNTLHISDVRNVVMSMLDDMERVAYADLNTVALDVVRVMPDKKIQAIKEVRERTGTDLRSAKLAVEVAMPIVAAEIAHDNAVAALAALDRANNNLPHGQRRRVNIGASELKDNFTQSGWSIDLPEPPF